MEPLSPITRSKSLAEQAADAIRQRIVNYEWQLGEALSEMGLATQLGISKAPVRQALFQLRGEGLVEIKPQRGTFVFEITPRKLRQLADFRQVVEISALHSAMRHDRNALETFLNDTVRRMAQAVKQKDYRAYQRLDDQFHRALVSASNNPFVESAYNTAALKTLTLRNWAAQAQASHDPNLREELSRSSLDEHDTIVRSLGRNRSDDAAEALQGHIENALDAFEAEAVRETREEEEQRLSMELGREKLRDRV